jgi:protein-tyrosine-phosphatase
MTETDKKLILFVCVSNTCRSPMAEYLFRRKINLKNLDEEKFVVSSRSLSTDYEPEGSPASSQGVEVMFTCYHGLSIIWASFRL